MTEGKLAPVADLKPLTPAELAYVEKLEEQLKVVEETKPAEVPTESFLHAGMYVRTCLVRAGAAIVGALIKIPTVVIVSGDCYVNNGKGGVRIQGYHVFKGGAFRKQAFIANTDTYITMCFATELQDLGECEKAFTDDYEQLITRRNEK